MDAPADTTRVALLTDLVGSRAAPDRVALHRRLSDALELANQRHCPIDPLRVTAGDEAQGVFATFGDALGATFTIRLALQVDDGIRFGLGRGAVSVIDPETGVQDGSAWWAARRAIETVEARAHGARHALRTGLASAEEARAVPPELFAAVGAVDALLAPLDAVDRVVLTALLAGELQSDAAARLGLTPSAVSQRVARKGLAVLADAITQLEEVR